MKSVIDCAQYPAKGPHMTISDDQFSLMDYVVRGILCSFNSFFCTKIDRIAQQFLLVLLLASLSLFGCTSLDSKTSELSQVPFPLPKMPPGLRWDKQQISNLQLAFSQVSNDTVTTCLVFKRLLNVNYGRLNKANVTWLDKALLSVKADALKTLNTHFSDASEKADLRGMLIAANAASIIEKYSIQDAQMKIKEVTLNYPSNYASGKGIWLTTNTTYSEHGQYYSNKLNNLQAPKGFKVISVDTEACNQSSVFDPPYAKSIFRDFANVDNTNNLKPYRTCSSRMVVLATGNSGWIKAKQLSGVKHRFNKRQVVINQSTTVAPAFRGIPAGYTLSMDWADSMQSQVVNSQIVLEGFAAVNWESGKTDNLTLLFIVPINEKQYTLLIY